MKFKSKALLLSAFAVCLPLSALAQEYSLKLAHVLSTSEPMHLASVHFAEAVAERSGGRIAIEVFPAGQLGSNIDLYEQVRLGAPVIQISDPGYLSDYVPDIGILNGPYLLNDAADFQKLLDSKWYSDTVGELAEKSNMQVLSLNWLFGSRHVISNKEIREPADMANLSIRVPPNVMWIETFKAIGARGETLAWAEVYPGLASGVVDAAEAPLSSLLGAKLFESAKTVSMTGHFTAYTGPVMSAKLFDSMPEDLQVIVLEEAIAAGNYMADLVNSGQGELIAALENEGVTIIQDIDTAKFQAATAVVYEKFPEWSEGLYGQIREILDN